MKNASHKKIVLIASYLLYYFTFQLVFQIWIVEIYSYEGYVNHFSIVNFVLSFFALALLASFVGVNESPSTSFLHFTLVTIFVPTLVLFAGQGLLFDFFFTTFMAISIVVVVANTIEIKTLRVPRLSDTVIMKLLTLIATSNVVALIYFNGFEYINFDFSRVYEFRREAAASLPGLFGYINSTVAKVVIPFGVVLSYYYKKWGYLLVFFSCAIFLFALTHHKSPLFIPILMLLVLRFWDMRFLWRVPVFCAAVVILSGFDFWLFANFDGSLYGWFGALFANRTLLVPANLNHIYIDFFADSEKYLWATSRLSLGLTQSPYEFAAPNIIGYEISGNYDMSANAGWIGSGIANAGYIGVIIYSFFLGLWFSLLDAYGRRLGAHLVFALFLMLVFTLVTSTDFTDLLLTHGLIFAIFILVFLNSNKNYRGKKTCAV